MGQYKVKILTKTQEDMEEIADYLNALSPQAAFRYYDMLVKKINSLSDIPERCPLARDSQLRLRGYRYLVAESYLVFFFIVSTMCIAAIFIFIVNSQSKFYSGRRLAFSLGSIYGRIKSGKFSLIL